MAKQKNKLFSTTLYFLIIILSVLFVASFAGNVALFDNLSNLKENISDLNGELAQLEQDSEVYKNILYYESKLSELTSITKANNYWMLAGENYEYENYKQIESNCKIARDYYFETAEEIRDLKVELKNKNLNDTLVDLYIQILQKSTDRANNMYEACEHFESASRYYDTYYNTDVPYDDQSYDMGGKEIDAMNEKITERDNNVEKNNELISEFNTKLEERLK